MKKSIKKVLKNILNNLYRVRDYCIYHSNILQRPKYNKKYNLAICTIFKDEARFLKEWIEYHSLIGIDHFYLYNNNSSDNYLEVLDEYIKLGIVTLKDWPYEQAQMKAYKDFYDNYWEDAQWISFLDVDEFFVPREDCTLLHWVKKHDKYPVLLVYWKMFGSSAILNHDDTKLCIEQYTNSWQSITKCGKCLINTDYDIAVFDSRTHHRTLTKRRNTKCPIVFNPVDQFNHINVNDKEKSINKTKSDDASIQINHYWSKGWDVYDKKRSWSGDVFFKNNPKKNISYFLEHEQKNTSTDYSIFRYLLLLKWKLCHSSEYEEFLNFIKQANKN